MNKKEYDMILQRLISEATSPTKDIENYIENNKNKKQVPSFMDKLSSSKNLGDVVVNLASYYPEALNKTLDVAKEVVTSHPIVRGGTALAKFVIPTSVQENFMGTYLPLIKDVATENLEVVPGSKSVSRGEASTNKALDNITASVKSPIDSMPTDRSNKYNNIKQQLTSGGSTNAYDALMKLAEIDPRQNPEYLKALADAEARKKEIDDSSNWKGYLAEALNVLGRAAQRQGNINPTGEAGEMLDAFRANKELSKAKIDKKTSTYLDNILKGLEARKESAKIGIDKLKFDTELQEKEKDRALKRQQMSMDMALKKAALANKTTNVDADENLLLQTSVFLKDFNYDKYAKATPEERSNMERDALNKIANKALNPDMKKGMYNDGYKNVASKLNPNLVRSAIVYNFNPDEGMKLAKTLGVR